MYDLSGRIQAIHGLGHRDELKEGHRQRKKPRASKTVGVETVRCAEGEVEGTKHGFELLPVGLVHCLLLRIIASGGRDEEDVFGRKEVTGRRQLDSSLSSVSGLQPQVDVVDGTPKCLLPQTDEERRVTSEVVDEVGRLVLHFALISLDGGLVDLAQDELFKHENGQAESGGRRGEKR
jgi:hypothetical protein